MSQHTEEPWDVFESSSDVEVYAGPAKEKRRGFLRGGRGMICRMDELRSRRQRKTDARRIVTCVNAMRGLTNPQATALRTLHTNLSAALKRYGEHDDTCPAHGLRADHPDCHCGLTATLVSTNLEETHER